MNLLLIKINMKKRIISLLLFLVIFFNILISQGGPSQPEFTGFQPVGNVEMVNHFTGDVKYSIPLLDVEGFPIQLNYLGQVSNNEDASWVGLGWNLNVGSINRQLRGIPDEFNGEDKIRKSYNIKSNINAGVEIGTNFQAFNFQPLKRKISLGAKLGIFYNNYTGWGHEIAISPSMSLSKSVDGPLNASLQVKSSSESGLSLTPGLSLQHQIEAKDGSELNFGTSIGVPISSREGFKSITLGMNMKKIEKITSDKVTKTVRQIENKLGSLGSSLSFASPTYVPRATMDMTNNMFAFSLNLHGSTFGFDKGGSIMGHFTITKTSQYAERPLFGFLNYEKANNISNAVFDFNRDKDVPYNDNTPILAVPNQTYDLFSVNQPEFSAQFRAYRKNFGAVGDPLVVNTTANFNLGAEAGIGNLFEGGKTVNTTIGKTITSIWKENNYEGYQTLNRHGTNASEDPYYFRATSDFVPTDSKMYDLSEGDQPLNFLLEGGAKNPGIRNLNIAKKDNKLLKYDWNTNEGFIIEKLIMPSEYNAPNSITFSFLTHNERLAYGLEKEIRNFEPITSNTLKYTKHEYPNSKINHHISEITITNNDGKRMIYGIPVYNHFQKEVSFNVGSNQEDVKNGFVSYSENDASTLNKKGNDHYFSSEILPAYPHTWLMTAILSPDYQDVTGDGVSDDDIGTALKINYSLKVSNYNWRNPATGEPNKALFNPGLATDINDSKASYTYGSREEWYVHSIESKNQIAIFFTSERMDAIGSLEHKGLDINSKKHKLDSIKLYSKSDFLVNGIDKAIPLKTVIFNTDYSLCKETINSNATLKGKLTLKTVGFRFLRSTIIDNKYEFAYNPNNNPNYNPTAIDKWGSYKPASSNPSGFNQNNRDYPYAIQNEAEANKNASSWLLNEIRLPSGAKINLEYESDRYSFIQNYRVGYMQPIKGFGHLPNNYESKLYGNKNHNFIHFEFPNGHAPKNKEEMMKMYFQDNENLDFKAKLYYKVAVRLFSSGNFEYIPGYASVLDYGIHPSNPNLGWVQLEETEGQQPVAFSAWQLGKLSFPKRAYPWSTIGDELGPLSFIMALPSFLGNLAEFVRGYAPMAKDLNLGCVIDPNKSFIRLLKPDRVKFGGGYRVKQVKVNDQWNEMTNQTGTSSEYGSIYTYETSTNGKKISSGVAEYEPMLGGDENPFRKPISYNDPKGLLAPTSIHYVEDPVCESLFPSPNVGYSEVKVQSINSLGSSRGKGYTIQEFYTAKDFPVWSDRTFLGNNNVVSYEPNLISSFLKIDNRRVLALSQGFSIVTNDMHGKEKANKIFNQEGALTEETRYFYKTDNNSRPKLINNIDVANEDGTISKNISMGINIDLFNDVRRQYSRLRQTDVEIGVSVFLAGIFPIGIPGIFPPFGLYENEFKSVATMKYVNKKGVLEKVYRMKDGASTTQNYLLWDKITGRPIVTESRTEYNDPLYSVTMPAYWKFKEMDAAYKNIGNTYAIQTVNGQITSSNASDFAPGDEVIYFSNFMTTKYWIVSDPNQPNLLYLVDRRGNVLNGQRNGMAKVIRSGRKNMLHAPMLQATMLKNPIRNGRLFFDADNQIISSQAYEYNDVWRVVKNAEVEQLKGCFHPTLERNIINHNATMLYPYYKLCNSFGGKCIYTPE